MPPFQLPSRLSWLLALLVSASSLSAATYTYDADANSANGITDGTASAWNTSTAAWFNGTSNVAWPAAVDATGDTAVFGFGGTAGSGTGTAGNVNVGTVTANGITFNSTNAGTYTLNNGTITLAGTNPTITANVNGQINSRIIATDLTKTGAGMLILNNSGNTLGNVTVNQGTLDVFSVFNADVLNVTGTGRFTTHSGNTSLFGTVNHSSSGSSVFIASNNNSTYTIGSGGLNISGTGQIIIESNNTENATVAPVSRVILQGNITATETSKITTGGAAGLDGNRLLDFGGAVRNVEVATGKTFSIEAITQNGGLTKNGNGILILTKANTYAMNTAVNAGTLRVSGSGTLGATTNDLSIASGATFDLGGTQQTVDQLTGSGTLTSSVTGGRLTVGSDNGNATFDGTITGSTASFTSIAKIGTGTQTFTAANTYSGGTIINSGVLAGTDSTTYTTGTGSTGQIKRFFGTGAITLNGGTLQVRANSDGTTSNAVNHILSLGNNLNVNGPATIDVGRFSGSATNKVIKFGILNMGASGNLLTVIAANNYSVEVSAPVINADTTFDVQSGSLTFASKMATTTHNIIKTGAGRLTLRANSTGNITVNAGILDVYDGLTTGNVAFNGTSTYETHSGSNWNMNSLTVNNAAGLGFGAFTNSSTFTIGTGGLTFNTGVNVVVQAQNVLDSLNNPLFARLILNGNVDVNANASILKSTAANSLGIMRLDLGGANRTFDVESGRTFNVGIVTENGGITKTGTGTMTLSDANIYAGETRINEGTLRLAATGSINSSTKITVASSAIYNVSSVTNYSVAAAQTLAGGGTVQGNVTISAGAFLAAGTTGVDETQTLTFANSLTLKSGSVTTFDLSSNPADTDHLSVAGTFTQEAGAKLVINGNGFIPTIGQNFDLFSLLGTGNTFLGNLGTNYRDGSSDSALDLDLPDIAASGYVWDISQFTTNGIITVAVPEPAQALLLTLAAVACFGRRHRRR